MSNLRLLGNSHADGVTINATSEETNYPIENIQIPQQSLKWRSTSAAIQKLWCQFTTPLPCSGFALWAHNLSHEATVQFTLYNKVASVSVSNAVSSSGVVTITTTAAHGLDVPATLFDAIGSKLVTANYPMYDIDVGISTINDNRASTILVKDYLDVYKEFGAADLPYFFGRVTGSVGSLIVYDDDGSSELTNTPLLQHTPGGTNLLLENWDFTGWSLGGSPIVYTNVTGIDGNLTGLDIEDDSATVSESIYSNEIVIAEGDFVTHRVWAKKEATGNVQAVSSIQDGASNTSWGSVKVTLSDGSFTADSNTNNAKVIDDGDWWMIVWKTNLAVAGDDNCYQRIYPTDGIVASTGRETFCCPEMYLNIEPEIVRGLPPIFTEASAASVEATSLEYDGINHDDTQGRYSFTYMASFATADVSGNIPILSNDTLAFVYYDASAGAFVVTDGTTSATKTQTIVAGTRYAISFKYSLESGKMTVYVDGAAGTAQDYDGSFDIGDKIYIFKDSAYTQRIADLTRKNISDKDALLISGVVGMTDINDEIFDVLDVPSSSTVEVALTTAQNYTSGGTLVSLEQVYNKITPAFLPRYGWGESPWGVSYWYGFSEDGTVPNYTVGWFDVVVSEYARIIIDDTGNNDGYVEVGRIKIGARWEPNVNFNWGGTLERVDESILSRTRDGSLHSEAGAKYRAIDHSFSFLDLNSAMGLDSIYKTPGKGGDVLVSSYPESGDEFDLATTIVGRIVQHTPITREKYGYSTSFRVEEG